MLSTIVLLPAAYGAVVRPAERVVRTLAPLVAAGVEGLVGDVVIAGPAALPELGAVADAAGCGLAADAREADWLAAAVRRARRPDLLILRVGYALGPDVIEEARDALAAGLARPVRLRAAARSLAQHLVPALAPTVGVLATTAQCRARLPCEFRPLVRALAPATTLRARLRPVM